MKKVSHAGTTVLDSYLSPIINLYVDFFKLLFKNTVYEGIAPADNEYAEIELQLAGVNEKV